MQNHFGVNVAFNLSIRQNQCWFKDKDEAIALQGSIKALVGWNITDEQIGFFDVIFISQVLSEPPEVKNPSLLADRRIQVLAINKGVVQSFIQL